MLETNYRNLTDFYLDLASEDIANEQFKDAANSIVIAMTEFDEQANIVKYLTYIFRRMTPQNIECLITEISKEMMWLCPKPYMTQDKRDKMLAFKRNVSDLFEAHGFEARVEEDCPQVEIGKPSSMPDFMFALKKRKGVDHPQ